jgi:hypothetical protein
MNSNNSDYRPRLKPGWEEKQDKLRSGRSSAKETNCGRFVETESAKPYDPSWRKKFESSENNSRTDHFGGARPPGQSPGI